MRQGGRVGPLLVECGLCWLRSAACMEWLRCCGIRDGRNGVCRLAVGLELEWADEFSERMEPDRAVLRPMDAERGGGSGGF